MKMYCKFFVSSSLWVIVIVSAAPFSQDGTEEKNIFNTEETVRQQVREALALPTTDDQEKRLVSLILFVISTEHDKVVQALRRVGTVEDEMKTHSYALWFERIRSAIEKFEDDLSERANIAFPTNQEGKTANDRKRIFREKKWKWIFQNQMDDYRVQRLNEKITASKDVATTDEFSELIARAFSEISEYIHHELLKPGPGRFSVKFATTDPKVNSVVELFMDLYEIEDVVVVSKPSK